MGYENTQYEETIDLKDLCIYVLRKWRMILIVMLVGAAVMGGYKAVVVPAPTEDAAVVTANTAKITENKTAMETNKATITANEASVTSNEAAIEANEEAVKNTRQKIQNTKDAIQDQKDAIREIEGVIEAYEDSLQEARQMLDSGISGENRINLLAQIPSLTSNIYSSNTRIVSAEQQIKSYETDIENLETSIKNLQEQNKKLQEDMEKLEEKNEELEKKNDELNEENGKLEEEMKPKAVRAGMGSIVKSAVLGAFLGAFIICGCAFLQYFFYKKLRGAEELKERYGYYILGDLYRPKQKKSGPIDRLLDKWADYAEPVDTEEEYRLIAARIRMASDKASLKLMVTGTVDPALLEQVCQKLKGLLPDGSYSVCAEANLTYNASAMEEVKQYAVVLVEAADVSDKREVAKLVEVLQISKVEVVGAVVL